MEYFRVEPVIITAYQCFDAIHQIHHFWLNFSVDFVFYCIAKCTAPRTFYSSSPNAMPCTAFRMETYYCFRKMWNVVMLICGFWVFSSCVIDGITDALTSKLDWKILFHWLSNVEPTHDEDFFGHSDQPAFEHSKIIQPQRNGKIDKNSFVIPVFFSWFEMFVVRGLRSHTLQIKLHTHKLIVVGHGSCWLLSLFVLFDMCDAK